MKLGRKNRVIDWEVIGVNVLGFNPSMRPKFIDIEVDLHLVDKLWVPVGNSSTNIHTRISDTNIFDYIKKGS